MELVAAAGWLIGIRTTRHAIFVEREHAREVQLSRILAA
jgi:hypothetical protein